MSAELAEVAKEERVVQHYSEELGIRKTALTNAVTLVAHEGGESAEFLWAIVQDFEHYLRSGEIPR